MKFLLKLFLIFSIITSCNDGDVFVTTFDFDGEQLQFCGGPGGYLFYKFNENGQEGIALRLGSNEDLFFETDTLQFTLDGTTNFFNYRTFDAVATNDYFCNEVPPTSPQVVSEFLGNSGNAFLFINTQLTDTDGLGADQELNEDTDNDGLLNLYDFDDDGDNVPTLLELDTENADEDNNPLTNPKDTDKDGIPDYLDEDDDGDGVLTRYEDADGNLDPTNDIDDPKIGPNFLNPNITNENPIDAYREHSYNFVSDVTVQLNNFILTNGEEQINRETFVMGSILNISNGLIAIIPVFID